MKVRVGYAAGDRGLGRDELAGLCRGLEELGFDSLWVTERATGASGDPVAVLTYAGAVTERIKLGMAVMALPGRQPALLAQQLATVDLLSGGRLLPAFGLGQRRAAEHQAFGVRREERVALFEELLPLLRRFWAEESVTHHGPRFRFDGVGVRPRPERGGFDVWMGGTADAELRRTGRLADGWLATFLAPAEAERGRRLVERTAAEHDREIDPEHFGMILPYRRGELPAGRPPRPGSGAVPPPEIPDLDGVEPLLRRYIDVGFSKFVLAPVHAPKDWHAELTDLRDAALTVQN